MSKTFVVAGAGFRGFCDTLELLKNPGVHVHIVDPCPFFGGIIYSRDVKGFAVDKGVHVFDSIPVDLAAIVDEIMEGRTKTIDFVSESAFNGHVTEGYSLPDLSSLPDEVKSQITYELISLAAGPRQEDDPLNLADLFERNYGVTAGKIFNEIFKGIYGIEPELLESCAITQTSMGRLKFLDDAEMMVLKSHPWLETVLAARRKTLGKVDDFVSIYPDTGEAMRGWCERTEKWLKDKGVTISLGEKVISVSDSGSKVTVHTDKQTIEADQLIWSNDNVTALSQAMGFDDDLVDMQHKTPLIFMTMITQADKIKDFTYLQNFDPKDLTYRIAAAGIFSGQIKEDGTSFITCECPATIGSSEWENADSLAADVWTECQKLGVVKDEAELVDCEVLRIPVTFKMPLLGYTRRVDEVREKVLSKTKRVVLRNVIPFYRRDIYLDSLNLNNLVN